MIQSKWTHKVSVFLGDKDVHLRGFSCDNLCVKRVLA